jgi:hypothetical protein
MNGDGHRHQQQEQQNQQQQVGQQNLLTRNMDMVAEEPFHDTSVYATDPQENVNSKPSTLLSTAHKEDEDEKPMIVSEDGSIIEGKYDLSYISENNKTAEEMNKGGDYDDAGDDGDTGALWAKWNARSIDEGIRFKSQLRQGTCFPFSLASS